MWTSDECNAALAFTMRNGQLIVRFCSIEREWSAFSQDIMRLYSKSSQAGLLPVRSMIQENDKKELQNIT